MKTYFVHRKSNIFLLLLVAVLTLSFKTPEKKIYDNFQNKYVSQDISEEEKEDIIYICELERLSNEIFSIYEKQYNKPIFARSLNTSDRYKETLKWLVDTYYIDYDISAQKPNIYNNKNLQATYNMLSDGSTIEEALMACAMIESLMINELETKIDKTNNKDVFKVYKNLLRKAENHYKIYENKLNRRGEEVPSLKN